MCGTYLRAVQSKVWEVIAVPEWVMPALAICVTLLLAGGGNALMLSYFAGKFSAKLDHLDDRVKEYSKTHSVDIARIEAKMDAEIQRLRENNAAMWKRIDELRDMVQK